MMTTDNMGLIDFHAHILPRADHGSQSLGESEKQLSLLKAAGVGTVVLTPHFYPDKITVSDFIEKNARLTNEFAPIAKDSGLKIAQGAEVLLCEGIDRMEGIERLTIKGTNTLLAELPFCRLSKEIFDTVRALLSRDFTIILAHIDRYRKQDILPLLEIGALGQINADAIASLSYFGLRDYFKSETVYAIGSDIHGVDKQAARSLAKAYSRIGKEQRNDILKKSEALLRGAEYL